MTGVGDDSRGRSWGGPWFLVGVALAVVATIALVLASDIRYLRLGIVAALWAALVGAFLAMRYRKQATSTEETVAQAQEIYELELEREIAARREYELEIESETRQRMEADSRAELDALRAEIGALRENLQSLFGGEVLLERLSLTAQATRMRALREEGRLVEAGTGNSRPALTAAKKSDMVDRPTELIERVREKQPTRPGRPAPEPRRPERSMDLPPRRVTKSEPVPARPVPGVNPAASVAKAAAEARAEQTRVQQPATPAPAKKPMPPAPTELMRPGVARSERSRPSMRPPEPTKPGPAEQPTQVAKALDADWTPAWETQVNREPPPATNASSAPATRDIPVAKGPGKLPRKPAEPIRPVRESAVRSPEQRNSGPATNLFGPSVKETVPVARREPQKPAEPPRTEEVPPTNPTLPEEARRMAQQGRSGGRRRRTEDEVAAEPAALDGGGHRRRADDQPASWMQPASSDTGTRRRAGHSRPELEPVAEPASTGRRAAAETGGDSGSHSAGRSVSDLLAAHGSGADTPRRRRRAAD